MRWRALPLASDWGEDVNGQYSELLLRFEKPRQAGGPYPVEAMIDGAGLWTGGEVALTSETLEDTATPAEYGKRLWEILAGAWPDFSDIFSKAWGAGGQKTRLRLMLDPVSADLHRIRWEYLVPKDDLEPAGVNPLRPVSRFLPLPGLPEFREGSRLDILLAIASPSDLRPPLDSIDNNGEIQSLVHALESRIRQGQVSLTVLPGTPALTDATGELLASLGVEIMPSFTSAAAIAQALDGKHVLHLIAHGDFRRAPLLMLEDDAGKQSIPDRDQILTQWSACRPRLVFLQSCRSDAADKAWPDAGYGPLFVQRGVPAVVAMRDFVEMDAARKFAAGFYRSLVETGEADLAANAGRAVTYRSKNGDWAIPVLYSRLRAGQRLWTPDPLRESIHAMAARLASIPEVRQPFPVEVTILKNVRAVPREWVQPLTDTRVDGLDAAERELASIEPITRSIILLGGRGRAKSALLKKLFVNLAAKSAVQDGAWPVLIRLGDCGQSPDETAAIAGAWCTTLKEQGIVTEPAALLDRLRKPGLRLLIDADDSVPLAELSTLLARVQRFLEGSDRSALITLDYSAFAPDLFDEKQTTVLLVQDLRSDTLRSYLDGYRAPDGRGLPASLKTALTGPFRDLAGIPWVLSRILKLAALDPDLLKSRFRVLDHIVREGLAQLTGTPGGRPLARSAMQEMAWRLHSRRGGELTLEETYDLLGTMRRARDFPLDAFRGDLLKSRLLVASAEEGIRFAYAGAHAYFTACYLGWLDSGALGEKLREIVAGLGSPERLDLWREVLLLLAGHMAEPGVLIRMLLDLGFGEGEHLMLAARCIHEARSAGRPVEDDLAIRLSDSLIWWSSYSSGLSTRSRAGAVGAFGYLLTGGDSGAGELLRNRKRILRHVIRIVLDRVRSDVSGKPQLDYSDVRLEALTLLFEHQELVLGELDDPAFGKYPRAEFKELIGHWTEGRLDPLAAYLNDPVAADPNATGHAGKSLLAGLAAFALVTMGGDAAIGALVGRFLRTPIVADLHWLIADGLIKLQSRAAMDLVRRAVESPDSLDPRLVHHVVYALGKLGSAMAGQAEVDYLKQHLQSGDVYLQGRTLRAFAEILGATRNPFIGDLRETCHHVLRHEYSEAQRLMKAATRRLSSFERQMLTSYALESLGHIGDESSIESLREFYLRPASFRPSAREESLRKMSWEIAGKIRLRVTERQPDSQNTKSANQTEE